MDRIICITFNKTPSPRMGHENLPDLEVDYKSHIHRVFLLCNIVQHLLFFITACVLLRRINSTSNSILQVPTKTPSIILQTVSTAAIAILSACVRIVVIGGVTISEYGVPSYPIILKFFGTDFPFAIASCKAATAQRSHRKKHHNPKFHQVFRVRALL